MTHPTDAYILAIDQGTSGTSATLFSLDGQAVASADVPVKSHYPQPGWVEQDPYDILNSVRQAIQTLFQSENLRPGQIECMGFAHQGESLLLWDLDTGRPVHNVISWQCVRSAAVCDALLERGLKLISASGPDCPSTQNGRRQRWPGPLSIFLKSGLYSAPGGWPTAKLTPGSCAN